MSDIIADLIELPFSRRPLEEKKRIISQGRPKPELPNLTQQQKRSTRHFHLSNYERCDWLTGSVKYNKLFCWNCLLFAGDKCSTWTTKGYDKLNNLVNAIRDHLVSITHIRASLAFTTFGTVPIENELKTQPLHIFKKHNEKVNENRYILKRLINIICLIAKLDLTADNESKIVNNHSFHLELLEYTAKCDPLLKSRLESSIVFKGVSNFILNDLIESIARAFREKIKQQLKQSNFFSILIDETNVSTNKSQFSLVYRYNFEGGVVERFVCFLDVEKEKSSVELSKLILNHIEDFSGCNKKLVALSYNGTLCNDLQANIKASLPQALFVQCYAHCLNFVLSQSASVIPACRIFFATLSGFASFFTKNATFLEEFLGRRLPHVSPTIWNYSSQLVNTIHENKSEIRQVFLSMLEHQSEVDSDILSPVHGLLANLENFEICFLLATFYKIFSLTGALTSVFQNSSISTRSCRIKIVGIQIAVKCLRSRFHEVYDETVSDVGLPRKLNMHVYTDIKSEYRRLYLEILDNVDQHLNKRLKDYVELSFLRLLDIYKYKHYTLNFPTDGFHRLVENYGHYFNETRLQNELVVAYGSKFLLVKSPLRLMNLLATTELGKTMPQIFLLTSLVSVVPIPTDPVELPFFALERIKTYIRNKTGQILFSDLGLMSIENKLLNAVKEEDTFFDAVMEYFATNDRRAEFFYNEKTSETPVKEADDPTPVEPAIKIKTEPVDDYPEPSTSKNTDHEEFILPDRNSSWSTPDSVVEPQFTLSVASLAFPIKSETPDDEQPKKKQRTNSSETSTFVSDTEIRTDNHVDSSEELAHPSLLNEHGRDEFDDFGGHVAGKLRNLDPISATCAKKDIEDTLVKAENGKYLNQTPNTTPSTSPVRI